MGIFEGRTPCAELLRNLSKISSEGCQITKMNLTLYQDPKTSLPTSFELQMLYVGKGNDKYFTTGKWAITRGIKTKSDAVVYQFYPDKGQESFAFLKADNNILFLLDIDRNLNVGGEFSYTLSRVKNK